MPVDVGEVFVAGVFGDESTEADLTEVVDDPAEFVDVLVEPVAVFVEDGEE